MDDDGTITQGECQQGRKSSVEAVVWGGPLFSPIVLFLPRLQLYGHTGTVRKLGALLDTCSLGHEMCEWVAVASVFGIKHMHKHLNVRMNANFVLIYSI